MDIEIGVIYILSLSLIYMIFFPLAFFFIFEEMYWPYEVRLFFNKNVCMYV